MFLIDNNVLVNANRVAQPDHAIARRWLEAVLDGEEKIALLDQVWVGVLRLITNRRVFKDPSSAELGAAFIQQVIDSENVVRVTPSPRCVEQVLKWTAEFRLTGDRIPDAYLAAVSIELDAILVTFDRGFGKYPRVKWVRPGENHIRINPAS